MVEEESVGETVTEKQSHSFLTEFINYIKVRSHRTEPCVSSLSHVCMSCESPQGLEEADLSRGFWHVTQTHAGVGGGIEKG